MNETQEQRKALWEARQREYRSTPEYIANRTLRLRTGQCVLEDGFCVTHATPDTMAHHFDVHPHAYND